MLALNGADQLNGPRQWGSLLFCLVIVLSLQRAEGSTEETGPSYTKIRILPADLACLRAAAAPPGDFQAVHCPAVCRQGPRHRRALPQSARPCPGAVRR